MAGVGSLITIHDEREKEREIEISRKENADLKIELRNIRNENTDLKRKIEDIEHEMRGGDSFCYIDLIPHMRTSDNEPRRDNDFELMLMHSGKYPLYDIQIRVLDPQRFKPVWDEHLKSPMPLEKLEAARQINYPIIPRVNPGFSHFIDKWVLPEKVDNYKINIQFVARNGSWNQQMRFMRHTSGTWRIASRTRREGKVLVEHGSAMLPKDEAGEPKWD